MPNNENRLENKEANKACKTKISAPVIATLPTECPPKIFVVVLKL